MQATTKSPSLEAHQNALKIIYSWTTPEQFDTAPALLKEKRFEILKPTQIATLLGVAENQRKLYASKATPITVEEVSSIKDAPLSFGEATLVEEIAEEYKEIDEEQFGAEEVVLSAPYTEEPLEIPTSNTPEFTPASEVADTPKRSRRTKAEMTQPTQGIQSVTVSRRVNLPIEGVQYSNNEFNVSVTASNREDAVNELHELTTSFLADQGLVRKSVADKTIADLKTKIKEMEAVKTPAQPAGDADLMKRHEKLRDMMNFIYKNSTNKEEFVALKEKFTSLPN